MKEIIYNNILFKQIKDFPNYYISKCGKVYSKKNNVLKKFNLNSKGYYGTYLYNNGSRKYNFLHRLIAKTFIQNPNNLQIIEHIDDNPLNCNIDNLKWSTQSKNIKKAYMVGNRKPIKYWKNKKITPFNKKIIQYDLNNKFIKNWISAKEIERELNINNSSIIQVCKGNRKTAGGFKWEYL